jgi:DMSO/TMAO reductase YedYZ molybdopterin-dependent catalytic subunit
VGSDLFSRRDFLKLCAGAVACPDPFADARYVGRVPFAGDDRNPPFHARIGSGLDARLYTDLSGLNAGTIVTPAAKFFVRTSAPDLRDERRAPWTIRVNGLVQQPLGITADEIDRLARPAGPFVTECAGNTNRAGFGLMSAAAWSGAPVIEVLKKVPSLRRSTRVRIAGVDRHTPSNSSIAGASWIFTLDQLESSGAMLATRMNGEPLPGDHGSPVRLIVPGWYGCTCIKWVDEIAFVDDTAPATSQMKEFAARTHQDGVPALAKDYAPASMDLAAFPIRIEKWLVGAALAYRVVGILWGGDRSTSRLQIRFNASEAFRPFDVCPPPETPLMWSLWSYLWRPPARGRYQIVVKPVDPAIRSRRLDLYFYLREVWIDEV